MLRSSSVWLALAVACESNDSGGQDPDDGTADTDPPVDDTDASDTDDPDPGLDVCVATLIESYVGPDLNSRTVHVYDGGLLVESTYESGYQVAASEFTYTSVVFYTYDANDRLVLAESDGPFGLDGIMDAQTTYTRNEDGQVTTEEYVFFADATRNSTHTYAYDGDGNLILEELDAGADGDIDNSKVYTYNAAGDIATVQEVAGAFTYLYTYLYDGLLQLIEVTIDTGVDGSIDSSTTYTYDAAGNVLTVVVQNGGEVDRHSTYTYDASGHRLTWLLEFPSSFLTTQFYTYTYDAEGNLVLSEYDEGNDGDVQSHIECSYECPDR